MQCQTLWPEIRSLGLVGSTGVLAEFILSIAGGDMLEITVDHIAVDDGTPLNAQALM